jgi:glycogen(starch) synthase
VTARDLRVLMTADTIGGVWTYACDLSAALAPLGVQVTLATMGAPLRLDQVRTALAIPNLDVHESRYALEWMPDPWRDVDAASAWLLDLARVTRPDVVHVNGYAHAALPFGAPTLVAAHSCVCSWFRAVRGIDAGPEWDEYRRRSISGLRSASAVVAPTAAILRAILAALRVDVPGRVIPNGRSALVLPALAKEPFVLSAGRMWDDAKGLADLVACAPQVGWPIRVAGPLVAPGNISAVDSGQLELLGDLAPLVLAQWMSRAAIYALPARYEPFGLSIVEAALAGCTLVLGDLDTLREIWGDAAVYVRPGDPDSLAFELNALAKDPVRRGALAACARGRTHALTPARMAAAYRALYAELATTSDAEVCA